MHSFVAGPFNENSTENQTDSKEAATTNIEKIIGFIFRKLEQEDVDDAINLVFRGSHFTVVRNLDGDSDRSYIGDTFEFVRIEGNFLLGRKIANKYGPAAEWERKRVFVFDLNTYDIQFLSGEYVRDLTGRMPKRHPDIFSRRNFSLMNLL